LELVFTEIVGAARASPLRCRPATLPDIDRVLARLRQRAVRRVPVVDTAGELIGVLSLDDILGWISEELRDTAALIERQSLGTSISHLEPHRRR